MTFAPADLVVHLPGLQRHARILLANRPALGAPDDFVQDTLVTALAGTARFDGKHPGAWLRAILTGHIRNAARRAKKRGPLMCDLRRDEDAGDETFAVAVPAAQEDAVACNELRAALKALPARDRRLIVMARFEDLSLPDMAARLDVPVGTVKSGLHRALAKLRAACDAGAAGDDAGEAALPALRQAA